MEDSKRMQLIEKGRIVIQSEIETACETIGKAQAQIRKIGEAEDLKASLEWKGKGELTGEQRAKALKRHKHLMNILRNYERQGKVTGIKYMELRKVV